MKLRVLQILFALYVAATVSIGVVPTHNGRLVALGVAETLAFTGIGIFFLWKPKS